MLLPGELESRTRQRRLRDGIPVSAGVLELIYELTDQLGVPRLPAQPAPPGAGVAAR